MAVESTFRPDEIVKQTFEVFSGFTGSMCESEFVDFCETSRRAGADSAKKIFSVVAENPDNGMGFQEFEESLGLLINLGKSSSESSAKNVNTATRAGSRGSRAVTRESSRNIRNSRQVLAPRGVLSQSNKTQSTPRPKASVEVAKAPVQPAKIVMDAALKMSAALKVPRCAYSQKGLGEGSQALLSLKARCSVSSASTASTASSPGSDRSDVSSVTSSPRISPEASPCLSTRTPPRLSTRRMSQTVR